jgi:hypothetical protein
MSLLEVEGKIAPDSNKMPASELPIRTVFMRSKHKEYFIRVKPTSYLLNSNTITENLNKGKPLVLNLNEGTLYFINGDEMVTRVQSATLKVER